MKNHSKYGDLRQKENIQESIDPIKESGTNGIILFARC
jgi:hypothetical protein